MFTTGRKKGRLQEGLPTGARLGRGGSNLALVKEGHSDHFSAAAQLEGLDLWPGRVSAACLLEYLFFLSPCLWLEVF